MCGIFGIVNDRSLKSAQTVLEGLKKLEYRGYDSWGIAIVPLANKQIEVEKHVGKIGEAKTNLPKSTIAIGHTRWATHGGVTDMNAHPHLDCSKTIAVIHNGIVENYQELKADLKKLGHEFVSETDTEVIAHLIEEEKKTKKIEQAVFSVFNKLVGSNAIGVLDLSSQKIICCRNGSPLAVGKGKNEYFLASDVTAFLKFTKEVHFLYDGEAVTLSSAGIKLFDLASGKEKTLRTETIEWEVEDAQKGGYPHFFLKEVMEQKVTIPKTANLNEDEIIKLGEEIGAGKKVIMIGCGSAYYCTLLAKYYFSENNLSAEVYPSYEFLPFSAMYKKETICIAVSQSGETADTIIAAKTAKKNGARLVAVVNARGSTLERMADIVITVGAGPEIAVVSTKAFTSQLATLYLITQAAAGKYEIAKKEIKNLGLILEKWLDKKLQDRIVLLAKELLDHEDMYLIGKNLNYPASLEFALKIKETSYIHSEAFAAGELKHGVITLIQRGTPCFALFAEDNVKNELISSAIELKARGGMIIGIGPSEEKEFDHNLVTPEVGNLTIFGNIIAGQLLGYYLGIGRGTDPDKPRNLAKSVTVK